MEKEENRFSKEKIYLYVEQYIDSHYHSKDYGVQEDYAAYVRETRCSYSYQDHIGSSARNAIFDHGLADEYLWKASKYYEGSFAELLLEYIDKTGKKDSEVYKRAGVSKSVFSKIRSGQHPDKKTAIMLAVALGLSLEQTQKLLSRAGYCLSCSSFSDLVVQAFIDKKHYDIDDLLMIIEDKKMEEHFRINILRKQAGYVSEAVQ